MVSCGLSTPHKLSGTTSSVPSSQNICKRSGSLHCPSQVRQYFQQWLTSIKRGCSLQAGVQFGNRNLGWCLTCRITLAAKHFPGIANMIADQESRTTWDCCEWNLNPSSYRAIQEQLDPLEVDHFASHLTKLLPWFYTRRPDPDVEATDAFPHNWALRRGFANPPWHLINRCLCQVAHQQARIVLLTLWWSTQLWFPVALGMLENHPRLLPDNPNLVSLPVGHQFIMPQGVPWLITWLISRNPSNHRAFLEKLQNFSIHGNQRQTRTTIHCVQDSLRTWCQSRNWDPFEGPVSDVVNF